MSEIPHGSPAGNDPKPPVGGYDPDAAKAAKTAVEARKAAEAGNAPDPDRELEAALGLTPASETAENSAERLAAITRFFAETPELQDCTPRDIAAGACLAQEADFRAIDPAYDITTEPVGELRTIAEAEIAKRDNAKMIASYDAAIAEDAKRYADAEALTAEPDLTDSDSLVAEDRKQEATAQDLKAEKALSDTEKVATDKELAGMEALQADYLALRNGKNGENKKSQIEALNILAAKYAGTRQVERISQILAQVDALRVAVSSVSPEDAAVFGDILESSTLNLGADNHIDVFSQFVTRVDNSESLSEEAKAEIHKTLGIPRPRQVKANSDVRKLAKQTKQIVDPETGEVREEYVHDSPENMAEFRPGVGTYMDGERMVLASPESGFARDVTGMSDNDIGLLASMMHLHATTEHFGATGFVESVSRTHFSGLFTEAFEPAKLKEMQQVLNRLLGGFTGYDGRVFDAREKMPLIRAQMRALSPDNQVLPWRRDEEQTTAALERYGLYSGGKPNLDVIGAFGAYTQKYKTIEPAELQQHLHELFPDIVEAPEGEAQDGLEI